MISPALISVRKVPMHHYRLGIGTALIAVAALTGCHSAGSTSAPTPTPSTPTTTSTASASRTSSPKPSAGVYDLGIHWKSGTSTITAVREKTGDTTHPEAAIALESCEDHSSVRTVDRNGKASHGVIIHLDSWYARDKAGTVKMIARNGVEVPSCDVK